MKIANTPNASFLGKLKNIQVSATDIGESAFGVLRLAFLFDGTGFVEKIENFDVSLKFDSIYLKQSTSFKKY